MTLVASKGPAAFRTISEAADELGVPTHVLRFWETKFSFIRPMKRAGGRRFYRPRDLDVLKGIRDLLHQEGYTIKGVQRLHKEQGLKRLLIAGGATPAQAEAEALLEIAGVESSTPSEATPLDPPPNGAATSAFTAAASTDEPSPARRSRPMLAAPARERLEAILHDLQDAKREIDAVLPRSSNDVD